MRRTGVIRLVRRAISRAKISIPSSRSLTKTQKLMPNGPGSDYRRRRNGSFAARGGLLGKPFVWGEAFRPKGKWMANTHQGHFPEQDTGEDGHVGLAPVAKYPPNGYGLYDMAGNVWQWTSNWYTPDYYQKLASSGSVARNPQGSETSFDPAEPGQMKKVHRGGSFLCTDQYCSRYMVGTRGKGEVSTGTNHLGFRCVAKSA